MKLITTEDDFDVNEKEQMSKMASQIDLSRVVDVLTRQLSHKQIHTRIAVLRWVLQLHMKTPNRVNPIYYLILKLYLSRYFFILFTLIFILSQLFQHIEQLFPALVKTLSDPSDEVRDFVIFLFIG